MRILRAGDLCVQVGTPASTALWSTTSLCTIFFHHLSGACRARTGDVLRARQVLSQTELRPRIN